MSGNLGKFVINTQGEYQLLSDITGIQFVSGKTYVFQCITPVYLCEKASKPENEGFFCSDSKPFQYIADNNKPVWVKSCNNKTGFADINATSILNIAE